MKRYLVVSLLSLLTISLSAQNISYAKSIVKELSSTAYYGRGYVKKGDFKAAKFIEKEFKNDNLLQFNDSYFQKYSFPINTFPKKVIVKIDGKELNPGSDFVVSLSASTTKGTYHINDLRAYKNIDSLIKIISDNTGDQIFLINEKGSRNYYGRTLDDINAVAVVTEKIPYWHVSNGGSLENTTWLKIYDKAIPKGAKTISIDVRNKFIKDHKTQNVVGWVSGKKNPDKYILFTAHYDHLGMMGTAMYPGANDNASGTAMVMDLARHFSKPENQPDCSIIFICLSGEETGLYGSKYFSNHSPVPLNDVKLVVNLDMVGSGSEGITVVNGTLYPELVKKMNTINIDNKLIKDIKLRGESCNSDHCPFFQKGVQSIFIYTRGKELTEYHTVDDVYGKDFPYTAYDGLFTLLSGLVE